MYTWLLMQWGYCLYRARYDTIEEFNVDSKAECGQLNLAHVYSHNPTNKRSIKKKLKQTHAAVQREPGILWRKGFVKQMNFKSAVKGRRSDRW